MVSGRDISQFGKMIVIIVPALIIELETRLFDVRAMFVLLSLLRQGQQVLYSVGLCYITIKFHK